MASQNRVCGEFRVAVTNHTSGGSRRCRAIWAPMVRPAPPSVVAGACPGRVRLSCGRSAAARIGVAEGS